MLTGLDRRLDRPLVDYPDPYVSSGARRQGDGEVARGDQSDRSGIAELDLGLGDLAALLEKRLRMPGAEAPIHELDRFLDPLVEAAQPGDDHDQPTPLLLGRTGEAVAGLLGMAGLQPVGAGDL